jgi:hypothetical protein
MAENKVAAEVAESDFARWLEAMDLAHKADESEMNADDLASFKKVKGAMLRAMMRGTLVVTDGGDLEFTPQMGDKSPILFPEPKGSAWLACDRYGDKENVHKTYGVLAAMSGQLPKRFSEMSNRDQDVVTAIFKIFFA